MSALLLLICIEEREEGLGRRGRSCDDEIPDYRDYSKNAPAGHHVQCPVQVQNFTENWNCNVLS